MQNSQFSLFSYNVAFAYPFLCLITLPNIQFNSVCECVCMNDYDVCELLLWLAAAASAIRQLARIVSVTIRTILLYYTMPLPTILLHITLGVHSLGSRFATLAWLRSICQDNGRKRCVIAAKCEKATERCLPVCQPFSFVAEHSWMCLRGCVYWPY